MERFDLTGAGPEALAALRAELGVLRTLEDVLDWARGLTPPVTAPAVVTQDEYTHDVLVPWREGRTLAFDVT